MGKSKELTTTEQKETLPVTSDLLNAMQQDAGAGTEEATRDDFAIPFLNVLQGLSPQVDPDNDAYIEGAIQGMILDSVTKEVFSGKEGILVIPCHFEKVYNEWVPRDAGGGFVASYGTKQEADAMMADENQLVDTANHYVMYQGPDGSWRQAVLSCTSTKLKASRQWITKLNMLKFGEGENRFTPPSFGTVWRLQTKKQTNPKGTFYNVELTYEHPVTSMALFQEAKDFRAAVSSGEKQVDYQKAAESEEGVADGGEDAVGY